MRRRDWSSLLPEVLQSIADRSLAAGALEDYVRFRAVCVSWRSATIDPGHIGNPQQLPWLMLPFDLRSSGAIRSFYRPSDGKVLALNLPEVLGCRILGSSEGWLVLVHISSPIRLFNPLTRSRIDLPPLTAVPFILDFDPEDLGYEYVLKGGPYGKYKKNAKEVRDLCVQKVITLSRKETGEDVMMVVMLVLGFFDGSSRGGGLLFARVGDDKWTEIDGCGDDCQDMLFHRGQLYVVNACGKLAAVEFMGRPPTKARAISIPAVVDATVAIKTDGDLCLQWYLVEMDHKLLIVCRCLRHRTYIVVKRTHSVQVFMVDIQKAQRKMTMMMREVKNLGDWMLFLGTNRAMSFNASNHFGSGWKGNHIYFTSTSFGFSGYRRSARRKIDGQEVFCEPRRVGDEFGVLNLDDGSMQLLPHCHNDSRFAWPPPIWFTPSLQPSDVQHKGKQTSIKRRAACKKASIDPHKVLQANKIYHDRLSV